MTKEDFIIKEKELIVAIAELEKEKRELLEDYIEEHRKYKNGDIVLIKYKNGITHKCFISYATEWSGSIRYVFVDMKKNGDPSSKKYRPDDDNCDVQYEIEYIGHYTGTEITNYE